jgi:ribosomal protein S18 acetylase RimI-like enzyme
VVASIHTTIRDARATEIGQLATIWYEGWQDAHARILPVELARLRTLESFGARLRSSLASVRVAGLNDAPTGFCILKGAELYQLYVSSHARGSGVAAALVADGEANLRESGVRTACLTCAIGNDRAARFYEKNGWLRAGVVTEHLEIPGGTFALAVWRYEKSLTVKTPLLGST